MISVLLLYGGCPNPSTRLMDVVEVYKDVRHHYMLSDLSPYILSTVHLHPLMLYLLSIFLLYILSILPPYMMSSPTIAYAQSLSLCYILIIPLIYPILLTYMCQSPFIYIGGGGRHRKMRGGDIGRGNRHRVIINN